ncbi:hypothetical protein RJ640_028871 [Escallonia rubra]|uniref:Serine incorporator 3 n=1 Tax=Escallonia rubra TaxID=112253 RepID=A0AA88R1B1_9ASTE|nr:hypothetical protein RJ640_028871 [Escallonia rubra]
MCLAGCCASLTCGLCTSVASGISKRSARLAYCGLFGISLIVSWILREVGINTSTHSNEWFQTQAVLRVSLGNFLFFAILALIMIGVKDQNDKRDSLHHGGWIAKMVIWALLVILMYVALLIVSITCYLAAFAFSGIQFIWFNPSGHDCGLNVFFIVMTMVLAFSFAVIALHPKVNGSLLPASVISIYCAYVCYTGLAAEPRDYECNGLHNRSKAVSASTLILGLLTTVLSVLYSAIRAGSSTTFLSPPSSPKSGEKKQPLLESEELEAGKEKKEEKKEDKEARPVSYSYTFFHLIFALASMYSAMLLSGWTSSESSELIDVGWTSVWVRICTEWVTAVLYVWSLLAPLLFPDREFF